MLVTMFGYNASVNAKVLEIASSLTDEELDAPTNYAQGSIRATLAHLLRVQWSWRTVTEKHLPPSSAPQISGTSSIAELTAFARAEAEAISTWVAIQSDAELATPFPSKYGDQEFEILPWQALTQMLFHSMQHRSEIALWLTEKGPSPGDLDFIYYADPSMG
ncbi:hypothetical protein BH09CHL1_BH09CHL1_19870 [soil metagenome]